MRERDVMELKHETGEEGRGLICHTKEAGLDPWGQL